MTAKTPLRLGFFADLVCPWCWIGWERLKTAIAARPDVEPNIVWQPYQLDAGIPPAGYDRAVYMARRFPDAEQRAAAQARIEAAGEDEGLVFRFDAIKRSPNTSAAHRVAMWSSLEGKLVPVVDALFSAYFNEGRDIGDHAALAEIAGRAGMDSAIVAERLADRVDEATVGRISNGAIQAGVKGVPFYVFGPRLVLSGAYSVDALSQGIEQGLETSGVN